MAHLNFLNRNIYFLLLLALGLVFSACRKKVYPRFVDLTSIEVENLDNTFEVGQAPMNDTVAAEAFGIKLMMNYKDHNDYSYDGEEEHGFFWTLLNNIDSVQIIADQDIDAFHPAGTNVMHFFNVFHEFEFTKIEDFFTLNRSIYFENESEVEKDEELSFLLMEELAYSGNFSFTVRFYVAEGEMFEATTNSIFLKS